MGAPKSSNFSKEEELLLQDFGRDLSKKSAVIFYIHAVFVSAIPIWLFSRIHQMDLTENVVLFAVGTLISSYLVSVAYKNNKFQMKHKIAQKRGDGIAAEMFSKMSEAESMQLAVFFSNSMFIILLIILSFFFFKNYSALPNYAISMLGASGITALLSTSSNKN